MSTLKITNVVYKQVNPATTECTVTAEIRFPDFPSIEIVRTATAKFNERDTWNIDDGRRVARVKAARKVQKVYIKFCENLVKIQQRYLREAEIDVSRAKHRLKKQEQYMQKLLKM